MKVSSKKVIFSSLFFSILSLLVITQLNLTMVNSQTSLAWGIEVVDSTGSVGRMLSVALDSLDRPHISYYDTANEDLKYAVWNGSARALLLIPWTVAHIHFFDDSRKW